jgi:hypothetical protein
LFGRYSVLYPCPKTRLLEHSSLGVQSSFTVYARNLYPAPLGPGQLSWDFVPLQRIQATRVHVLPAINGRLPGSTRKSIRYLLMIPTSPATVPLTGFLNLSATFSSHYRPAIFRQVAFMGFALQGFSPFAKPPATHRRQTTLLSFFPPVAQLWILGPEFLRAHDPPPRMVRNRTFIDFRVFVLARVSRISGSPLENVPLIRLAPPGLSPPHGIYPRQCAMLTLRYRHASVTPALLPEQKLPAFHGLTTKRGWPPSREVDQPSQGFSPSCDLDP